MYRPNAKNGDGNKDEIYSPILGYTLRRDDTCLDEAYGRGVASDVVPAGEYRVPCLPPLPVSLSQCLWGYGSLPFTYTQQSPLSRSFNFLPTCLLRNILFLCSSVEFEAPII